MKFVVYLGNNNYHPLYSGKQKNLFHVKIDVIFALLHLWENNLTELMCMKSFVSFFKHFVDIDDTIKCWNDIKLEDRVAIVEKIKKEPNAGYINILYYNMKIYDSIIVSTNGEKYYKSDYFNYGEHQCKKCNENIRILKEKEKNKMFENIKKRVLHSLMHPSDN
jgi:hypothetical protein